MHNHLIEALIGTLVLIIAVFFGYYGYVVTGASSVGESYAIQANFPNAGSVKIGSDVRISGIKVGVVTKQKIEPEGYQARMKLAIRNDVKLPVDTMAMISSDGLMGGSYISLLPGGDDEMLLPGDDIVQTQGAVDLMGLVGRALYRPSNPGSESLDSKE